jgi:hypothetical protein
MSQITQDMIEAGAKACRDITFNALTMDECRDAVRAAITAALSALTQGGAKGEVNAERDHLAKEARRYASHYPEASDGRNTFIIFAEMIEHRMANNAIPSHPNHYPEDGSCVRCGAVPRNSSGLCATCLDEDAERAGEIQSQDVEPLVWMNSEHVDQYKAGTADGIAWANKVRTDFYTVPLYTLAHQPVTAGWLPIETAPRDDWNKPILACRMGEFEHCFGNEPVAGYAEPPEATYWNDGFWTPVQRPHDGWEPTHWQPLPIPPLAPLESEGLNDE